MHNTIRSIPAPLRLAALFLFTALAVAVTMVATRHGAGPHTAAILYHGKTPAILYHG